VLLIQLTILSTLIIIFKEDMQSRSVHWFWFLVLMILFILLKLLALESIDDMIWSASFNMAFIAVQLLLVTAYFSIKFKTLTNITTGLLGWGDILFIASVAFYLPFLNFIAFYISSLIVVLISWIAYIKLLKREHKSIPLAGMQAVIFAVLLLVSWIIPEWNLNDDSTLTKLFS
jgi:hypothetical protein